MRISPTIQVPRGRNPRTTYLETAVELANPMQAWFRYGQLSTDTLYIQGKPTNAGDSPLLIHFRIANADYTKRLPFVSSVPDGWIIDLSATTIDLNTLIGGIVDGVPLIANIDYLVWAFADEYRNFKGFGITARPRRIDVLTLSGGGLGVESKFTITAGYGWLFNIGARVIIRQGTALSGSYNQGIVVAHTSSAVTVQLDSLYTEIDREPNTTLASLTGLEMFQIDNFAPRMYNEDSLYPGSGVEYQYSYLGSIQTDNTFNMRHVRYAGDWYPFPVESYIVYTDTNTVTSMFNVCLARWIPVGTERVSGFITIEGTNIAGYVKVMTDSVAGLGGITGSRIIGGGVSRMFYDVQIRLHNATAHFHLYTTSASSMTGNGYITSYKPETF